MNVAAFEVVSASFQRAANRTADVCYWSSMPGGLSRGIVIVISALFIKSAASSRQGKVAMFLIFSLK